MNTIKHRRDLKTDTLLESLRTKLKNDKRTIAMLDLGSGSSHFTTSTRKINTIAKTSLTPGKFAAFYSRIVEHYDLRQIVELGTSLGICTLYLARKENANVTTFEGSPEIATLARSNFDFFQAKNIDLHEGDIDTTLPSFLDSSRALDFIFMDANHRYEPTKRYFNWFIQRIHKKSIMVIDDIHYSMEMEKAWEEIRMDKTVHGSLDLYRCGILFFDPSLNKQHYVLQF